MTRREQKAMAFLKECFGRGQWFKDHPADHTYRLEQLGAMFRHPHCHRVVAG